MQLKKHSEYANNKIHTPFSNHSWSHPIQLVEKLPFFRSRFVNLVNLLNLIFVHRVTFQSSIFLSLFNVCVSEYCASGFELA